VPHLHVVCTGNAARSVMAATMLVAWEPGVAVSSSGTHVIEGLPLSLRTRAALGRLGLAAQGHRSAQLHPRRAGQADLVVAMAVEHVRWVRRNHPELAARTATLRRFVRDLPGPPAPLGERIASLGLADIELDPAWEDVEDPGGGEDEVFHACAAELVPLVRALSERVTGRPATGLTAADAVELATDLALDLSHEGDPGDGAPTR
jgi:protein-tyrosine-phosphatase